MRGQTHEFIIYAVRQQAKAGNLTIYYRRRQTDVSFSCVCPDYNKKFQTDHRYLLLKATLRK